MPPQSNGHKPALDQLPWLIGFLIVALVIGTNLRLLGNLIVPGPRLSVDNVIVMAAHVGIDFGFLVSSVVQNSGGAGKVRVTADLTTSEDVWTKHEVIDMTAGERKMVKIFFHEPHFLSSSTAEALVRAQPEYP